jgi:hypothetical protein
MRFSNDYRPTQGAEERIGGTNARVDARRSARFLGSSDANTLLSIPRSATVAQVQQDGESSWMDSISSSYSVASDSATPLSRLSSTTPIRADVSHKSMHRRRHSFQTSLRAPHGSHYFIHSRSLKGEFCFVRLLGGAFKS